MLKKYLESKGFVVSDQELEEILKAATEDIKFNNIGFKKKTSLQDVINIASITATTLRRCC